MPYFTFSSVSVKMPNIISKLSANTFVDKTMAQNKKSRLFVMDIVFLRMSN